MSTATAEIRSQTASNNVEKAPESHSEGSYRIFEFDAPERLDTIHEAWADLAQNTSTPNPFYAPTFFLPATKNVSHKVRWKIFVVQEQETKKLTGFFPFTVHKNSYFFNEFSLWKTPLNFLTTPLIRAGHEEHVWKAVWSQVTQQGNKCDLLRFPMNQASGRIHQELQTLIRNELLVTFETEHYARAQLEQGMPYEQYIKHSIGGRHLRNYRRLLRNLKKEGEVEFRVSSQGDEAASWANWFIELEASGWKGAEGTALRNIQGQADFFHELVKLGFQDLSVQMVGLFFNDHPIAICCLLLSQQGAFTYKIAFDEDYKKYSPGVLLELEMTETFLDEQRLDWLDSCAVPNHPMINRLWGERRSIQDLTVSSGKFLPDLYLGILSGLRAVKRTLFRKPVR